MRYVPLALWVAITVVFELLIISDHIFGGSDNKDMVKRMGLALIWPLAALSRRGREILFQTGREL